MSARTSKQQDTFWPVKPSYVVWTTMLGAYPTATKGCRFADEAAARAYVEEQVTRTRKGFQLLVVEEPSGRRVCEQRGVC